ncbi:MAG: efflux RND transporter permease subunit [Proteobacteria bacterium]|nr:efflux RND transporter permease subunit [Pseudomonadota bacterium]
MRDAVANFTTSRPVAVLMVFVAAVVFGYFSYGRLSVTLMPELSYPTITVRTEYPGAAPEEVEKDVSRPIEEALGVIGGLRKLSSASRADMSDVVLEFSWDTSISDAVQEVLEKLDLVRLPEDAGPSLILRFDPSLDPVVELSLSSARAPDRVAGRPGDRSGIDGSASETELRRLRRIAELQIKRALEPIQGVAAVRVRGGLEEEIHISLDGDKLTRMGVSIDRVIERLAEENVNVAGGTVKEGRTDYMVRTVNEFVDLDQINDTIVAIVEGREIRISDLGNVAMAQKERDIVTRTDGRESVQIDIFKEADANIVALAKRVKAVIGTVEEGARGVGESRNESKNLASQIFKGEDALLAVVADRSTFIESSIDEVRDTAILGGILAVIVLFLFLRNAKSTTIIALSIPISLLVTFVPLNVMGVSLNIMSLGGLALGIGMLVDSSIVVLESIYRCREEGDDTVVATIRGTRDVRGAVVASILTTIGVFLPMVFVEGVAGQAFGDLGLAVVLSLLASLVVALFFIPMLASRRGIRLERIEGRAAPMARLFAWRAFRQDLRALPLALAILLGPYFILRLVIASLLEIVAKLVLAVFVLLFWLGGRFVVPALGAVMSVLWWLPLKATTVLLELSGRLYPRIMGWAIDHTGSVLLIVAACFGIMYTAASGLDSELLPEVHQGEFTIEVALPVGTPIEETEAILAPVERAILAERDHIESLIVTLGYDAENSQRSDEGEHTARFKVLLEAQADNATVEQIVAERIRGHMAAIPDVESRLVRPVLFSFRTPIEVEVYGDDLVRLHQMVERVKHEMAAMPELTDIETTLRRGAPEVQIVYHRDRLRRYGLSVAEVANRVRDAVKGREATRLNLTDRRVPIVVRFDESDRQSVDEIKRLIVDPDATQSIALAAVADVDLGQGPSEIRRVDSHRVALIRANLARGSSLGAAVDAIENRLNGHIEWPSDMSFNIAGQRQEWERSRGSLWLALGLSVFLVYVIMAAQFESLLYPLIIMFSIPLAFFGTFVTLRAADIHLSIVVFLGMIMLAGIVVNNAIVLVDYINILKRRGMGLVEAVIRAGSVRLRPILMSTATTVLGLVPMTFTMGDGAELRTPLAITVISGLVASTALTLVVIPTIYVLVDRVVDRLRGFFVQPASRPGSIDDTLLARAVASGNRSDGDTPEARS